MSIPKIANTNIDKIREETLMLFDAFPFRKDEGVLGELRFCDHPFTDGLDMYCPEEERWLNLTKDEDAAVYRNIITEIIAKSDMIRCYLLIQSRYKLAWFKLCAPYMSDEDFAEFLRLAWIETADPNQDSFVSRKEAVQYFKSAKKECLMNDDDLDYYNSLPNTITVYRGVSPNRAKYGLSWTDNKKKAEWFQHRFEKELHKKGYLLKATINKKHCLAYINDRKEKELVIDVFAIRDKIKKIDSAN